MKSTPPNRKRRPSAPSTAPLRSLARLHGVQSGYLDMAGHPRHASTDALLAVLRTLGVPVEGMRDVPAALRAARRVRALQVGEPVHVAWQGQATAVPLRLPESAARGPVAWEWRLEDGEVRRHETRLERLPVRGAARFDGTRFVTVSVPVPSRLPQGYQRLVVEGELGRFETWVFRAPVRCFEPPASPGHWGVFTPLYALHSERSVGAGNLADLAELMTWVGAQGGGFVGTLPLLAAFLDAPCEPSPYSPASRLFWNEFYLDLASVPELASCPAARRLLQSADFLESRRKLGEAALVDYATQMALQRRVLEALSRSFFAQPSARRDAFEQFLRDHPHATDYAGFRAVREQRGEPWTHWPERLRRGDLRDADGRASVRQYHLYVQWLAHEQMAQLSDQARRRGVELYLDMPLGTHRDGYDTWRYQELFALQASGGAPPDPVFTQGQDWGFAPMHPQGSREQGHAYVRAYLCHHLRHARMLRFDHVMGLHRLYWVPAGCPASQGAYVTYPAGELYAMLSIESHRHRAVIIGENLGTVPPEVDRSLRRHGVSGMFVVQYEVQPPPRPALRPVPARVVASLNTHDMPPFAAFWEGLDLADRLALRLLRRGDLARERRLRDRVRRSLVRFLRRGGCLAGDGTPPQAVGPALLRHLGASEALWVLVNLEDLWLETESQNTPGTTGERVNWRRKARLSWARLREDPGVRQTLADLNRARRLGRSRPFQACSPAPAQ